MKKVLFTASHPGCANALAPVIKALYGDNDLDFAVVGEGAAVDIFKRAGVTCRNLLAYAQPKISIVAMKNVIQRESPNLVVTGQALNEDNTISLEQATTRAGRECGIPCIGVMDSWMHDPDAFTNKKTNDPFAFLPDFLLVHDELALSILRKAGVPNKKLHITGNPYFDSVVAMGKTFDATELRQRLGIGKKLSVVFAGNIFYSERKCGFWDLDNVRVLADAYDMLSSKNRLRVFIGIKLHPRMPEPDKRKIKAHLRGYPAIKLIENEDSRELVAAADLVLFATSTVGAEAAYMRKPCISLRPNQNVADDGPLTNAHYIMACFTPLNCVTAVHTAMTSAEYRRNLLKYSSRLVATGSATKNIIAFIKQNLATL